MEGLDLSFFVKTKSEAQDFSARLSAIIEKVYSVDFNLEKELLTQLGIKKKEKFLQLLGENNIPAGSVPHIQEFLTKLLAHVTQLSVLSVVIAFEPQEQTLQFLSQWFVLNIKKQMLLDISVDPKLIAGAMITVNGNYIDMSIKPLFDKICTSVITPPIVAQPVPTHPAVNPTSVQSNTQTHGVPQLAVQPAHPV